MKAKVLDSSFILDFVNQGYSSSQICSTMTYEADEYLKQVSNEKLKDWEICFRFRYNNVKQILIYIKGKSDIQDKYKEITIHIPIPMKDRVSWGVDLEQHIYQDENHLNHLMKNFLTIDVDFSIFTNRQEYILDCMRRSIKLCFEKGFTVNGEKVRILRTK